MSDQRLDVRKTCKLHIGGQFVRSESGCCLAAQAATGAALANYCWASRKDFRDAVAAARGAFDGWARRAACLRGQILYRAAEMLASERFPLPALAFSEILATSDLPGDVVNLG